MLIHLVYFRLRSVILWYQYLFYKCLQKSTKYSSAKFFHAEEMIRKYSDGEVYNIQRLVFLQPCWQSLSTVIRSKVVSRDSRVPCACLLQLWVFLSSRRSTCPTPKYATCIPPPDVQISKFAIWGNSIKFYDEIHDINFQLIKE